jgi:hypothetical protein
MRKPRILKDRHLKMTLYDDQKDLEAIWFHALEKTANEQSEEQKIKKRRPGLQELLNTFFGPATVNFRIKDARSDLA